MVHDSRFVPSFYRPVHPHERPTYSPVLRQPIGQFPFGQSPAFGSQYLPNSFSSVLNSFISSLFSSVFSNRFPYNPFPTPIYPTPNPTPTPSPGPTKPEDLTTLNYRNLSRTERENLTGLTDREIAIFHLWGRQMSTVGQQNGAIYNSVLDAVKNGKAADGSEFTAEERKLVQELSAKEKQQFGGFTGRILDEEFFKVFQKITGADISQRFANRPVHFAGEQRALFPAGSGELDSDSWTKALSQQSGLSDFEESVIRFWGHDPLFSQGKITGQVLPMTLVNPNSLDKGSANQTNARELLKADLADDGVNNGSSLAGAFNSMLDKLYFGTGGTSIQQVQRTAQTQALQRGRSMQQIQRDVTFGVQNAIDSFKAMAKDHPIIMTAGAMGIAGATAICPFFAGMGAAAAAGAMVSRSRLAEN